VKKYYLKKTEPTSIMLNHLEISLSRCYPKEKIPKTIDEAVEIMKNESETIFILKVLSQF
jgi:hypothetical protein